MNPITPQKGSLKDNEPLTTPVKEPYGKHTNEKRSLFQSPPPKRRKCQGPTKATLLSGSPLVAKALPSPAQVEVGAPITPLKEEKCEQASRKEAPSRHGSVKTLSSPAKLHKGGQEGDSFKSPPPRVVRRQSLLSPESPLDVPLHTSLSVRKNFKLRSLQSQLEATSKRTDDKTESVQWPFQADVAGEEVGHSDLEAALKQTTTGIGKEQAPLDTHPMAELVSMVPGDGPACDPIQRGMEAVGCEHQYTEEEYSTFLRRRTKANLLFD